MIIICSLNENASFHSFSKLTTADSQELTTQNVVHRLEGVGDVCRGPFPFTSLLAVSALGPLAQSVVGSMKMELKGFGAGFHLILSKSHSVRKFKYSL